MCRLGYIWLVSAIYYYLVSPKVLLRLVIIIELLIGPCVGRTLQYIRCVSSYYFHFKATMAY